MQCDGTTYVEGEDIMPTTVTKIHLLRVVRRAYGPEHADSLAARLPDHVDLENTADTALLAKLGLTPDGLFSALGGEL